MTGIAQCHHPYARVVVVVVSSRVVVVVEDVLVVVVGASGQIPAFRIEASPIFLLQSFP
jgi:RNase P/RNase MRP subunit POP5